VRGLLRKEVAPACLDTNETNNKNNNNNNATASNKSNTVVVKLKTLV